MGTFEGALEDAFSFDQKVVVEAFVEGRELECSVLGNNKPVASVPGEIIPRKEFYSYEAKYIDEEGAYLKIPAELETSIIRQIQDLAVKTFKALCCKGMARVDFFLKKNNDILVNEINTICRLYTSDAADEEENICPGCRRVSNNKHKDET